LRSLISLLYVIHVCKGSFTSPLMHCILYFMWVRALSSLLHVIQICRGVNFTSLSSWMYIAYIFLLLVLSSPLCWFLFVTKRGRTLFCVYFNPFVDDWQKGGEVFWYIYACFPCFIHKGGEGFMFIHICFVLQKGEENLMNFMLDWHVYLLMFVYMFVYFMHFIIYLVCLLLCMS